MAGWRSGKARHMEHEWTASMAGGIALVATFPPGDALHDAYSARRENDPFREAAQAPECVKGGCIQPLQALQAVSALHHAREHHFVSRVQCPPSNRTPVPSTTSPTSRTALHSVSLSHIPTVSRDTRRLLFDAKRSRQLTRCLGRWCVAAQRSVGGGARRRIHAPAPRNPQPATQESCAWRARPGPCSRLRTPRPWALRWPYKGGGGGRGRGGGIVILERNGRLPGAVARLRIPPRLFVCSCFQAVCCLPPRLLCACAPLRPCACLSFVALALRQSTLCPPVSIGSLLPLSYPRGHTAPDASTPLLASPNAAEKAVR